MAVGGWAVQKKLPVIDYYGKTIIAGEHLIQFIYGTVNRGREYKSQIRLELIDQFFTSDKIEA